MFSLGDGTKFWLYTEPTDMRKNFNMLSGIVNDHMGQNLYSGDVFVFVNSANNMMKLLRYEPGGLVIYNKRLDHGRMHLVKRVQEGDPASRPSNGVALSIPSSIYATTEQNNQFSVSRNIDENHIIPINTIR